MVWQSKRFSLFSQETRNQSNVQCRTRLWTSGSTLRFRRSVRIRQSGFASVQVPTQRFVPEIFDVQERWRFLAVLFLTDRSIKKHLSKLQNFHSWAESIGHSGLLGILGAHAQDDMAGDVEVERGVSLVSRSGVESYPPTRVLCIPKPRTPTEELRSGRKPTTRNFNKELLEPIASPHIQQEMKSNSS